MSCFTNKELLLRLGKDIKTLRLLKNITRQTLCSRANINLNALRHLEDGQNATVKTLIAITQALGRTDWLVSLAPTISINPLDKRLNRKRARRPS